MGSTATGQVKLSERYTNRVAVDDVQCMTYPVDNNYASVVMNNGVESSLALIDRFFNELVSAYD